MRESAAAQLTLLRSQPEIYQPASTQRESNTPSPSPAFACALLASLRTGRLTVCLSLAVEEHRQRAAAMVAGGV